MIVEPAERVDRHDHRDGEQQHRALAAIALVGRLAAAVEPHAGGEEQQRRRGKLDHAAGRHAPHRLQVAVGQAAPRNSRSIGRRHHQQPAEALRLVDADLAARLGRAEEAQAERERARADQHPQADEDERVHPNVTAARIARPTIASSIPTNSAGADLLGHPITARVTAAEDAKEPALGLSRTASGPTGRRSTG